jgi:hypothetical protein
MLDDILDFSALSLVDDGRLSFWMPTANDEDQEIKIPQHPSLEIISVCTQAFNRCKSYQVAITSIYTNKLKGQEGSLPTEGFPIPKLLLGMFVSREPRRMVSMQTISTHSEKATSKDSKQHSGDR